MKKFLIWTLLIIVVILVVVLLLGFIFGSGDGFGLGKGKGDGGEEAGVKNLSNITIVEETEHAEVEEIETEPETSTEATEKNKTEKKDKTILEVTVVKKEYLYKNKRIELDELIEVLTNMDSEVVVMITDDNASLRAYKKLTNKLDELSIPYSE